MLCVVLHYFYVIYAVHGCRVGTEGFLELEPEAVEVPNVQVQQVRAISYILKRIRRRKSERILKIKLGKTVGGVDDPGNSKGKALIID
uniref:Uncharacterized protein n=1 Tax=Lactuca sativa TaxID=4236 RepID=A0A9R1WW54_LACSA|nr:hypothetical protein LSAT_V11C900483400 [Lactuca sativa]